MPISPQTPFSQVVSILPPRLQRLLNAIGDPLKKTLLEIRLRANAPIQLVFSEHTGFLTGCGTVTALCSEYLPCAEEKEISETLARACGYSVYSHQQDLCNGFVTLPGGHRIGVCGTAVHKGGAIAGLRDPTALNLRIARQIPGTADRVLSVCFQNGLQNVLLAGLPMSGKTTVLRDMAVQIAKGYCGRLATCAVIDARDEIFPPNQDAPVSERFFGDVLRGFEKAEGIARAVRTLSPEIVFCDEIGTLEDAQAIAQGMLCGVHFAATVHAENEASLFRREGIRALLTAGCFSAVVFLGTGAQVGKPVQILQAGESDVKSHESSADFYRLRMDGGVFFAPGTRTTA